MIKRKLQERNGQYTLTLPRELVLALGWGSGEYIEVELKNRKLLLGKI